jgi:hypothetical protein
LFIKFLFIKFLFIKFLISNFPKTKSLVQSFIRNLLLFHNFVKPIYI